MRTFRLTLRRSGLLGVASAGSPHRLCRRGRGRARGWRRRRRCCICTPVQFRFRAGVKLRQFLGSSAGLSAATITRLTTQWQGERTASDEADILLHKRRSRGPDGRDDVTNAPLTPVVLRHQADILLHKG